MNWSRLVECEAMGKADSRLNEESRYFGVAL